MDIRVVSNFSCYVKCCNIVPVFDAGSFFVVFGNIPKHDMTSRNLVKSTY